MTWTREAQDSGRETLRQEERLGFAGWSTEKRKALHQELKVAEKGICSPRTHEERRSSALKCWETRRARYGPAGKPKKQEQE